MLRIAIVISHPIQHFCPMYASWASNSSINLKVFFGTDLGAKKYFDSNFGREVEWNNLYLNEFNHEFLNFEETLKVNSNLDAQNLNEKLDEFAPDLLIIYGYFHRLTRRARNWAINNKVKIAYISDAEHRQKRPIWKEILKFPYLYFYFRKVDLFLFVGDANKKYYHHYGVPNKKLKNLHFSIDLKSYKLAFNQKDSLKINFKRQHSIDDKDIVISVVGKLVNWKCQDHLIDLLFILENNYPFKRFHLLIAGSGPMEELWFQKSLKVKINQVHFLGFVPPSDLPSIYAASDVYIHPALIEPHSLSISEAIYMGCPVIVSDTSGSWGRNDDVQINKNGFIYQHGNINELKEKLLQLIVDEDNQKFSNHSIKISRNFQNNCHFEIPKLLNEEINF